MVMEDLLPDPDNRFIREASAHATRRLLYLRDRSHTIWMVELSVAAEEVICRFPCRPNTRTPVAPEEVFGLEASFHGDACMVAWICVPQKYRRRGLAAWMVRQLANECANRGIRWIRGTIEPNDDALPFWLAFGPQLEKNGSTIAPDQARGKRGIRFTLDSAELIAMPESIEIISEETFEKMLPPAGTQISSSPSQCSKSSDDPFWLTM